MAQEDYASKAHAVRTNWNDISPNYQPSAETKAIFEALTYSETHSSLEPQAPGGYHVEVMKLGESTYQTYYFTRELTPSEKNDVDALFNILRNQHSSGGASNNV